MKITSFLLATLTAIALLSCSFIDNSNSPAEDGSYPKALQKVVPVDDVQGSDSGQSTINATGQKCVSCGSMTQSSPAICLFNSLPPGSTNVSYQFTGGGFSCGGVFSPSYIRIQCGNYVGDFTLLSYANISTSAFKGTPANVTCTLTLYGTCYGTPCTCSIPNIQGCQEYTY